MTTSRPADVARTAVSPDLPADALDAPVVRFDRVERAVHWCNATLFGILMLTGAALYAGPISTLVGRRALVRAVHVYSGLALPVPLVVALCLRAGRQLRADLRALSRWIPDDSRWLFSRGRDARVRLGKFNPGQKLNATFVAAVIVVMLATGSIMNWFSLFPTDYRTGAEFVHDWFALGLWLVVIGHVWLAFSDPVALHGMTGGSVTASWARRHRPRWYDEISGSGARGADR